MKKSILLFLFLAINMVFIGCKDDPVSAGNTSTIITGKITDSQDKLPVDGVVITTVPAVPGFTSYTTDTTGKFRIDLGNLSQITIKVYVKNSNYDELNKDALVVAGQTTTLDFEIIPKSTYIKTGSVFGIVTDSNKIPLKDVIVRYSIYLDTTDINGKYELKNIPVGTRIIYASKQGYNSSSISVAVARLNPALNITLKNASPPLPLVMVAVAGGVFTMGDTFGGGGSNETPTRSVTLSNFSIGKTEVTQKQWSDIMGSNPSVTDYGIGDNYPVNQVNWYDIMVFCNKLSIKEGKTPCYSINGSTDPAIWGAVPISSSTTWNAAVCNWSANGYRMPTEAEWEYAARGASANSANIYSGSNNIDEVAWYSNNSGTISHEVGTKKANELGLFDMSGNVREWCWDRYGTYPSTTDTNPKGATTGTNHVLRGGNWYDSDGYCRVAYRSTYNPLYRYYSIGFRLVVVP